MGGKSGQPKAPGQDELAHMYAANSMMSMAQRNPYAAQMFRPGTEMGDFYKNTFGTSDLPTAQPFKIDPIGAYSMAASRIYGGQQPELYGQRPQQGGFRPGAPAAPQPQQGLTIQGGGGRNMGRR